MKISYIRRWTKSAIECYKRGCICRGCTIKRNCETKCRMKETVLELVRKYGRPKDKEKEV